MGHDENNTSSPNLKSVTRAVVWNQALWTAGYSLTTGGFLAYFCKELGATGFKLSLILIIPETVGILGLMARSVIRRIGNRKQVWLTFSLAARVCSIGIPLMAFPVLHPAGFDPLWIMIGCLAMTEAINAIAYMAYISWLSDLVPEYQWGRFFAKRNIAKLCVLLVVPVVGGYLRDWWRDSVPPEIALWSYVAAFTLGILLLLLSLLPLLRLPNVAVRFAADELPTWRMLGEAFRNRSLRFLMLHNWWLAFANGLTQAAFFSYLFGPLSVSLGTLYVLFGTMRIVKIPISALSGFLCDRFGNKALLFWGVLTASLAMPFWLLATPEQWWWVFGAYAVWGMFAAVNISGRNLTLKLSPRSDNATQFALFRQVAGLLAGLSGLLGGLWLDSLLKSGFEVSWGDYRLQAYQLLFLISFLGRATASFWILPIQEPRSRSVKWMVRALLRWRRHTGKQLT